MVTQVGDNPIASFPISKGLAQAENPGLAASSSTQTRDLCFANDPGSRADTTVSEPSMQAGPVHQPRSDFQDSISLSGTDHAGLSAGSTGSLPNRPTVDSFQTDPSVASSDISHSSGQSIQNHASCMLHAEGSGTPTIGAGEAKRYEKPEAREMGSYGNQVGHAAEASAAQGGMDMVSSSSASGYAISCASDSVQGRPESEACALHLPIAGSKRRRFGMQAPLAGSDLDQPEHTNENKRGRY